MHPPNRYEDKRPRQNCFVTKFSAGWVIQEADNRMWRFGRLKCAVWLALVGKWPYQLWPLWELGNSSNCLCWWPEDGSHGLGMAGLLSFSLSRKPWGHGHHGQMLTPTGSILKNHRQAWAACRVLHSMQTRTARPSELLLGEMSWKVIYC